MKLLAVIALTGLLLGTPSVVAVAACSCHAADANPVICISKDSGGERLRMPITLQLHDRNSHQLSAELTRITGKQVVFATARPDEPLSLDIKNAPLWDVLESLSESGKVQIAGEDFSKLRSIRKALVTGEKVSLCIENVSVQQVVNELSALSGQSILINSDDAKALVTLSAQGVTLKDILARVSTRSGVQLVIESGRELSH